MDSGIYQIRNLVNDRRYIGEGMVMRARFKQHQTDLRCGRHFNARLQEDWSLLGPDAFSFERIAFIAGHAERRAVEVRAIASMFGDGCYNAVVEGPPSAAGKKLNLSPEERERRRVRLLGNTFGVGHKVAPEHTAKLKALFTGKPRSDAAKAAMRAGCIGRKMTPMTDAHRAAVAAGRTGIRLTDEVKAARKAAMIERGTWGRTR